MRRGAFKESTVVLFLVVLLMITLGLFITKPGGEKGIVAISDISYVVFAAIAAIAGIMAARVYRTKSPQGKLLLLLTMVPVFGAIAGSIWAWYEVGLGILSPFPSVADWFWLLFYVFGFVAFGYALSKLWKYIKTWHLLVAGITALILTWGAYLFALKDIFTNAADSSFAEVFFGAMYPVGDIILIGMAVLMFLTLRKGVFGESWRTFTVALTIYGVADLVYGYQLFVGTYKSGGLIDLLWPVGNALIAYAFYQQIKAVQPA
ncbi:hypothetical protein HY493_00180 [Candidatus Woesearchaeota archaeon]|nr:hypothetical protein [Candidatus Woesearchaeota archaeon]